MKLRPDFTNLLLVAFAFSGLVAADHSHPRDVTSTLMFGVLVWFTGYQFGSRVSLTLAVASSAAHFFNSLAANDAPQSSSQMLEELSEGVLLILLALQGDRFRETVGLLKGSRKQALELHAELKTMLDQARRVQMALQGSFPSQISGATLAARALVAQELGGDFILLHRHGSSTLMGVADVSGKGPQAALVAAIAKGVCHEIVEDCIGPAQLLERLERRLAGLLPDNMFVTLFVCSFDSENQRLSFCGAGHEPALLLKGGQLQELWSQNLPLGPFAPQQFVQTELDLQEGACLLIFSDGLPDAMTGSGTRLGAGPIEAAVQQHSLEPARLVQHLEALLPARLSDDVSILALVIESEPTLWDCFTTTQQGQEA